MYMLPLLLIRNEWTYRFELGLLEQLFLLFHYFVFKILAILPSTTCENNFTETEELYKFKYNHINYHKEYTYIYADPKTPPNLGVWDLLKCIKYLWESRR